MFLQKNKLVALIFSIFLGICTANASSGLENIGGGIKLSVKDDLIESLKIKLLPEILSKLNNFTVADQELFLDFKIAKLNIDLKNILITLNTTAIGDENFQVSFKDPNRIIFEASGIQGSVTFNDSFTLGFLKEHSKVNAELYSFGLKVEFALDQIESKQSKGKFLPLISLQNIEVNLDFEYNLQGDWLIKIANSHLIKGFVIKLIKNQINSVLSGSLKKTINQTISNAISNLPANAIIDGKFLSFDYEILSAPKIQKDKFLTLNLEALLFNSEIPQTLSPPFNFTEIPDFNDTGKDLELMLSEYTINSALYTMWLSGLLQLKLDTSLIPAEFPVKLNTTALDIVFNGVSAKYGVDRPIELNCAALDNPIFKLAKENFDFSSNFECKIFVLTNNTELEQAYWFNSRLGASVRFALEENGHANVNINYAIVDNSQMLQTTVQETNMENIENLINFVSSVGLPYVNKNYLNNLKINIPVLNGVDFNNSSVVVKDKYVDFHITPDVNYLKFLNQH